MEKDYSEISMRDAVIRKIYEMAERNKNIVFLSADMGAPALDDYRRDFAERFSNPGIAEQNMLSIATGLAKEGKIVFNFAIAPFITSRCYESTKLTGGLMRLPIKLIGVGAGFGYEDSGPTHHTTEDIAIMRAIPHLEILSPSDSLMAEKCAEYSVNSDTPVYLRLERAKTPVIHNPSLNVEKGFKVLVGGFDRAIVSTGYMVHQALRVADASLGSVGVIDLYRLNPVPEEFKEVLSRYKQVYSVEEHLLNGGLGSIVSETITDNGLNTKLKRIGLDDYVYDYGRESLHKTCGIDYQSLKKMIL